MMYEDDGGVTAIKPVVLLLDTFTTAANSLIQNHAPDIGPNASSTLVTGSSITAGVPNRCTVYTTGLLGLSSASSVLYPFWPIPNGAAAVTVTLTVVTAAVNLEQYRFITRAAVGNGNFGFSITLNPSTGALFISRGTGGGIINILSTTITPPESGDVIKIIDTGDAVGNAGVISLFINDVLVAKNPAIAASFINPNVRGFGMAFPNSTALRLDNLQITSP